MSFDYPLVRDVMVINDSVKRFWASYQGPGPAVLLARTVTLESDFVIGGGAVVIVADVFDGNGFTIDARGVHSAVVSIPGAPGVWPGFLPGPDGIPAGPGGSGGSGTDGGDGTHAGSVVVFCREARNLRIIATGGNGTNGAPGANGSSGVNGFFREGFTEPLQIDPETGAVLSEIFHPPVEIPGTSGGSGGNGGKGGNAGNGGIVSFTRITDVGVPVIDVTAGQAGAGAGAGIKGPPGLFGEDFAVDGTPGEHGTPGTPGSLTMGFAASDAEFGALIRPLIGDNFANHWAPFRIAMGDFHYRQYNPPLGSDETHPSTVHLKDALRELTHGLELQPDNPTGLVLLDHLTGSAKDLPDGQQIWVGGGINALGLPRDLDLLPDFQIYQTAFGAAVPPLLSFALSAIDTLSDVVMNDSFVALATMMGDEAAATRNNLALDIPATESERAFALKEVEYLDGQLMSVRADIETNLAAMAQHEFSIGDVLGTIAQVGSAVVAVIGALPSFGASLVGLVPALVSLSDAVLDNADDVAKSLFKGGPVEDEAVKKAYGKAEKKAEAVIKGGKTIINFIKVVKEITARSTPSNAQHVALVARGVELTHQLLMAGYRVSIADQRLAAAKAKVGNADGLVAQAAIAKGAINTVAERMKVTGLLALSTVRMRSDAAMRMAFLAQRSLEIYTLRDHSDKVRLDTGMISPEVDRQFLDDEINASALIGHLQVAWGKILDPIRLSEAYLAHFTAPHGTDWHRKSFPAGLEIEALKATRRFAFRIAPDDLPIHHIEAKVRSLRLALVGAVHPNGNVSCEIKRGPVYEHRLADGGVLEQVLSPRKDRRPAKLGQLAPDEGFSDDPPLTAPGSLAFWGRGVCGSWEVSIPEDQLANGQLDLTNLSLIQLWVEYQHTQGPA